MKGVAHIEFQEQGQTVNFERYISTFRALKLRLRRVRRDNDSILDSILQNDNARWYTSRQTQDPAASCIQPRSCPLYYHLSPQLQQYLKVHHYGNDEQVIADVRR
ncbi:mariner mos1 transposase [Elysia marginata]|uniref:Mariner mos1 transposase n=1 Tax=Elysia marginata TaxID=1093978 RepID=A0AAV4F6W6_9GAST|nr:mariner mos1 transposase [Elysia marginata]